MIIETAFTAGDEITSYNGKTAKILKVDISITVEAGVEIFYIVHEYEAKRIFTYTEELVLHWQETS